MNVSVSELPTRVVAGVLRLGVKSVNPIAEWLTSLGLADYVEAFRDNHIDFTVLPDLTDQDLMELGMTSIGHRRRLTRAIADIVAARPHVYGAEPGAAPVTHHHHTAERRQITVMFCDLVGSTALSARLDPEDMREVMLAYQHAVTAIAKGFEGFVAKYMGDGILIYFGYPRAHEDDPERAVQAALSIVAAVARLETRAPAALEVRIGIATGVVVIGDLIGDGASQEEAVVGETPNLAARLQSLAKPGTVLVSASTKRLIDGLFILRDLGSFEVRGWAGPVEAWAVDSTADVITRFAARATSLTEFFGREAELEELVRMKVRAFGGFGQAVLIRGEAGIGKSRVAARLAEIIGNEPHVRIAYQCTAYHQDTPLHPMISQIQRAAGIAADDAPARKTEKLETLLVRGSEPRGDIVPLIAELLSIPANERFQPLQLTPAQYRRWLFDAILARLDAVQRSKPVFILLEDAHWADATSRDILDQLIGFIGERRVFAIVTARPEFEPLWATRDNVGVLRLGRLDRVHATTMVERLCAGHGVPSKVVERIVVKTDGVPLFVEELTKTVIESGFLRVSDDGTSPAAVAPELAIPATLQDSLMARLDHLAPIKEIAQIGSVIGREFSYRLLLAVAPMDEVTLKMGLAKLEEAELATRSGSGIEAIYTFKHALVQDAAYDSLLKSKRQLVHRMIAIALRDSFPLLAADEPEVIAHHFARADKLDSAVDWWAKAGEQALRRSAYHEARAHFEKAIEAAARLPADAARRHLRLRLQVEYGNVLIALLGHSSHETTAAFARTAEIAADVGDNTERFAGYYGVWVGAYGRGEVLKARELAAAFLHEAEATGDPRTIGIGHFLVGSVRWSEGDYGGACAPLESALGAYDRQRDLPLTYRFGQDIGVSAKAFLALTLWPLGDTERARRCIDEVMEDALSTGHIHTQAYAHFHKAMFEAVCDLPERALPHASALLDIARTYELSLWYAGATFLVGWARWRAGEREAGEGAMREARGLFRRSGAALAKPLFAALWAEVRGARDPRTAADALGNLLAENAALGLTWFDADLHRRRALLLVQADPALSGAVEALETAVQTARRQRTRAFELRAQVALATHFPDGVRGADGLHRLEQMIDPASGRLDIPEFAEASRLVAASRGTGGAHMTSTSQ